ncbi:MAG: hypothetical protein JWP12_1405 [Bacteroidetes bacterium]|nr:hypothetical protein [Bacteroidota bacterium]
MKINQQEAIFRNELIFAADAKAVNVENILLNLFMLLNTNGVRPKQLALSGTRKEVDLETMKNIFRVLEDRGEVAGFKENPEAVENWLRCNLLNMVNRGKIDKEKISSLRPIHLESYKLRNASSARDYNTADQVYYMLNHSPNVRDELRNFLAEGWDKSTNKINLYEGIDVDSLGILMLIKDIKTGGFVASSAGVQNIKPILEKQAELFCDDVRRLLLYKRTIPRNVLLDYLKIIIAFHLSIYVQKLIYLLPKMIKAGVKEVEDDWSIVLDVTDNFESKVAVIANADAEKMNNSLLEYIKSTFQINAALRMLKLEKNNSLNLDAAIAAVNSRKTDLEIYYQVQWDNLSSSWDEDDKEIVNEFAVYEDSSFNKYIELLMRLRGNYQYRYYIQMIDNFSNKNNERGFIAQGRSKKHPRRFVLGTRLLEALTQINLLENQGGTLRSKAISIEELMEIFRKRYGLIINGLEDPKFAEADLNTIQAFKENVGSFKSKLRQIGFYNDLSDAFILQKIRPRYEI